MKNIFLPILLGILGSMIIQNMQGAETMRKDYGTADLKPSIVIQINGSIDK